MFVNAVDGVERSCIEAASSSVRLATRLVYRTVTVGSSLVSRLHDRIDGFVTATCNSPRIYRRQCATLKHPSASHRLALSPVYRDDPRREHGE
jgi:hypothetical protein